MVGTYVAGSAWKALPIRIVDFLSSLRYIELEARRIVHGDALSRVGEKTCGGVATEYLNHIFVTTGDQQESSVG